MKKNRAIRIGSSFQIENEPNELIVYKIADYFYFLKYS